MESVTSPLRKPSPQNFRKLHRCKPHRTRWISDQFLGHFVCVGFLFGESVETGSRIGRIDRFRPVDSGSSTPGVFCGSCAKIGFMNRLVIIDGHAIMHRAFHALPPLTTSKGQAVNAVYGFVSMLLRVLEELKPSHLLVVFDTPKPTFRNKLSKDYQAKRPETDKNLVPQFELAHKVVTEMGITHLEKDGFEADDVIGTISQRTKNREQRTEVIIITGDRDLLQLVDEKIRVYLPVKGLSQSKLFGEKEVEEKLGVTPSQVVDLKALIGDSSDNYPGVSGIGPKTAVNLLHSFGSFEGIYKHLAEIKSQTTKDRLMSGKKNGELSKKLATIACDVPIDFNLDNCKLASFYTPQVRWLFEELEFKSLIPRLSGGMKNHEVRIKNKNKEEDNIQQVTLF